MKLNQSTMRAMRHKVQIQNEVLTEDGEGGFSSSWKLFHTAWVMLKNKDSRSLSAESFEEYQVKNKAIFEMLLRYKQGVSPSMKVVYGTRVFSIIKVQDVDEDGFFMNLLVQEV